MPRSAIQIPCVKTARLDGGCDDQEPIMRPGEGPSISRLCDAPSAMPAAANVSSPTSSPSTMATDQVLAQFIQMIAVHQAMMQETTCKMQALMIQQASFQSELIAQATFQCSTFAHEFRADYPTKNANSIESCGAMANAVSLLTAAPVGLPGFEPTHSLEMLLGDGYDLVRHQQVGNISSALSGFPTTSQFDLEESKSRDVLLAPGFYYENPEISLPNQRKCGVDGSGNYSSCLVTSCVPATSCLLDRLNLPGIGDAEIVSYYPQHNDESVGNKVCAGIERYSSGISVADNSIPSLMGSSFSATHIEANCIRSVSTGSLQSTAYCHLPVTKSKQPMEVLQCGDIAPAEPPRARNNFPTTLGPGSVPLANYQLLNVEYSESCELLLESPRIHCGTLENSQAVRCASTSSVGGLVASTSRPCSNDRRVSSPSSSPHIEISGYIRCFNQPYYGPNRPDNCGDLSKLFCGYGHEPLLRLAPDIDICVAPFNSPVLSSDSFSKPHFKSIASAIAPPWRSSSTLRRIAALLHQVLDAFPAHYNTAFLREGVSRVQLV